MIRHLLRYGSNPTCHNLLSGLHTANLSWQTRVGKPKLVCVNGTKTGGKHVTFANCWRQIETCLPTVFMPFTHTNLSLPTRVCQLKFAVRRPLNSLILISTLLLYHSFVTLGYFVQFLIYFTLVIYLCLALHYKFECSFRLILPSTEDGR